MSEDARFEPATPVVWMFPGQGVQYFHMARALYGGCATFRSWMDRLDAVASDYVGQSVVEVMYDDQRAKSDPFDQILYSHPALFMVQFAMARTLQSEGFPPPDYLLGASLGEFVAAAVAGVAEPETMLFDLIKQARLFEAHCSGGGMLIVIDDVDTFRTNPAFSAGCELAGTNFDRCFVVSGEARAIARVAAELKQQDVTFQVLPIPVAFHSSRIDGLQELFVATFAGRACGEPRIPIISCAVPPDGMTEQDRFSPAYWWRVIRQPIELRRTLLAFERAHPRAIYVDLGPSGNMAGFAKYNLPASAHDRVLPVMTPFGRDREGMEAARGRLLGG